MADQAALAILAEWHRQFDEIAYLVTEDAQIEVRFYANRGKVRKTPTIVLNGGPQQVN